MPTSEWKFSLPAVVVQFPLKHTDLFTVVLQRKRNTILKHSVLIKRHLAFNYVPFNIVNAVAENIHIGDWLILSPSSKSCTISDIQSLIVVYELSYRKIGYYSNTHIPANKTSLRCSVIDIKNKIIILTKEFETMPADYITIPYGAPNGSIDEVYNKASECLTSWCANGEVLKKELFTPDMELKSNTINETLNKLGLQ
jgi:hypothetical protein